MDSLASTWQRHCHNNIVIIIQDNPLGTPSLTLDIPPYNTPLTIHPIGFVSVTQEQSRLINRRDMWAKSLRERCRHDRATSDVRIFKNETGSVQIRLEKYCYLLAGIYVIGIQYVCLADKISVHDKFQFIKTYLLVILTVSTYILFCKYTNTIQFNANFRLSQGCLQKSKVHNLYKMWRGQKQDKYVVISPPPEFHP